ncbi:MAG: sulfate ABC transporter permease subunit CysT [Hyphomonadaceae bacterium]|nr:sulfate ABC transporter permease subunit CysT [Clostridia bacterium]
MGFTLSYLSILILIPLSTIFMRTVNMGWDSFFKTVLNPRVLASYQVSFGCAFTAALTNTIFGLIIAWVLVRYDFPFKRIVDGLIDLPFALPTAVAGIALTTLYAQNGWVGKFLYAFGIQSAYSTTGITIALIFIGIPFVVRTVQPILEELEPQVEEAATMLGANRNTIFLKTILPELIPPLLTGFALAFARGIGEYGSVVFISGNMPMKTEIAPLMIMSKLEQYDYAGATAIAMVMLFISFLMLLVINIIQWHTNKFLKV